MKLRPLISLAAAGAGADGRRRHRLAAVLLREARLLLGHLGLALADLLLILHAARLGLAAADLLVDRAPALEVLLDRLALLRRDLRRVAQLHGAAAPRVPVLDGLAEQRVGDLGRARHPLGELGVRQHAVAVRVELVEVLVDGALAELVRAHDVEDALHLLAVEVAVAVEVHVVEQEEELLLVRPGLDGGAHAHGGLEDRLGAVVLGALGLHEVELRPLDELRRRGEVQPAVQRIVEDLDVVERELVQAAVGRAQAARLVAEDSLGVAAELVERRDVGEADLDVVLAAVEVAGDEQHEHPTSQ
mmetsp:Transcript_32961/g.101814  ORF Transcript_32961/g.101814 Transcript_32961/m.101814 type:complete len:303 (-) Transcript_32961:16-924(-)